LELLTVQVIDKRKPFITTADEFSASITADLMLEPQVEGFAYAIDTYSWELVSSLRYNKKSVEETLLKGVNTKQNILIIPMENIKSI